MIKLSGIYKITSPSKKIYIGQSVDIIGRWNLYKKLRCKNQTYLYYSLKKYGFEKHKFEIICQCILEDLNNLEKYYVDLYQTFNSKYGMNLKDGGGSKGVSSDATKLKQSASLKGENNPFYGKKHSEETRLKLSEIAKKRKLSVETKKKIGESIKGKKRSQEIRLNMSNAVKNMSIEKRKKITEAGRQFQKLLMKNKQ